jgi:hypothetical protein
MDGYRQGVDHTATEVLRMLRKCQTSCGESAAQTYAAVTIHAVSLEEVLGRYRQGTASSAETYQKACDAHFYMWHMLSRLLFSRSVATEEAARDVQQQLGLVSVERELEIVTQDDLDEVLC